MFFEFLLVAFKTVKDFFVGIFTRIKGSKEKKKAIKAEKERLEVEKHSDELLADSFFTSDDSISELKIEKLGISEVSASTEAEEVTTSPAEESVPAEAEPAKKFAERPKRTLNLDYGLGIEDTSSPKAEKASAPAVIAIGAPSDMSAPDKSPSKAKDTVCTPPTPSVTAKPVAAPATEPYLAPISIVTAEAKTKARSMPNTEISARERHTVCKNMRVEA